MPCRIEMQKMPITIIRPLCLVKEKLLKEWAIESEYQPLVKVCPYEKESKRTYRASLFDDLENMNPDLRGNLGNALAKAGKLVEEVVTT